MAADERVVHADCVVSASDEHLGLSAVAHVERLNPTLVADTLPGVPRRSPSHAAGHAESGWGRPSLNVSPRPIGVLIVDDHPVVLGGLADLLSGEPGIEVLAAVDRTAQALEAARELAPDVAVVDFHIRAENGLELACRLAALTPAPRVVVYSAFPGISLIAAAMVADAFALIAKSALPHELLDAIRATRRGRRTLPALTRADLLALASRVRPEDRDLLGMFAHAIPATRIAQTIGASEPELLARRLGMVRALTAHRHATLSALQGGALHYSSGYRD
jgi:two-component system, NarL family, response regulator